MPAPQVSDSMNPCQARPAIEIRVEAQDGSDSLPFHYCDVDGVLRGHLGAVLGDFTGSKNIRLLNREHFVNDV